VLAAVRLVDEMDEQMWTLLQGNLKGLTEAEADWRPHPSANSVRWMLGHLAWFEEWAHDALRSEGRYLIDRDPTACLEGTIPDLTARFAAPPGGWETRPGSRPASHCRPRPARFGAGQALTGRSSAGTTSVLRPAEHRRSPATSRAGGAGRPAGERGGR